MSDSILVTSVRGITTDATGRHVFTCLGVLVITPRTAEVT